MQYQITSDNIDLSPSMEALTKEKFERIEARTDNLPEGSRFARVVLNSVPDDQFEVKVNLILSGKEYFSDETAFTLENALVVVVEELLDMIEKDSIVQRRKDLKKEEDLEEFLIEEV
ncbi:HPF/RaiA family ribosome-associated protein [Patescibacteria group bacterium]|nr:HPF/RaiA family ribosome-associated protein [Patescibacteria group bacterium]